MPRNSACRQAESGSARISSRLPTDLPRAPVTRPWKWWTISGRWVDRPLAPRCSTKSPQIPHGSRLLFSIWATRNCPPTPAPAVRFKLYSSDGPDPARAPRTGSIQGNSLHRGCHLAADCGRMTGKPEVTPGDPIRDIIPVGPQTRGHRVVASSRRCSVTQLARRNALTTCGAVTVLTDYNGAHL